MMRRLVLAAALALVPLAGMAQGRAESLADIRSQLGQLGTELSGLRSELVSTGAVARAGGADMLQRMEMIELELMRLTGKTEELELRINRVVADGTNRLGDLEFRVVELEGGDPGALQNPAPLGDGRNAGGGGATPPAKVTAPAPGAAGQQAEFDRARAVLGQGDFRTAADLFAAYAAAHPQDPLSGEALFLRAEALEGLSQPEAAARSYLDSFSGFPDSARAPEALFRLARALGRLGQVQDACILLSEVDSRYPGHPVVAEAGAERLNLQCP